MALQQTIATATANVADLLIPFKKKHTIEKRKEEAQRVLSKYPERIPIIAERAIGNSTVPIVDKKKYLVPSDLTVGQFIYVLRKRIKLLPEQALFVFVGKRATVPVGELMSKVYKEYKDDDGFLYVTYAGESTFGFD